MDDHSHYKLKVIKDFNGSDNNGELKIEIDENIVLFDISSVYVKVKKKDGKSGFVPLSCVDKVKDNEEDDEEKMRLISLAHHPYFRDKDDELNLAVGDLSIIKYVSSDGWGYATRKNTSGWIPLNHTVILENNFQGYRTQRRSSYLSKSIDEYEKKINDFQDKSSFEVDDVARLLKPWEGYEWFYKNSHAKECYQLLSNFGELGDFLIRLRKDGASMCLMVLTREGVMNYLIQIEDNKFKVGDLQDRSLRKLIDYFYTNPIGFLSNNTPVTLVKCLKRRP